MADNTSMIAGLFMSPEIYQQQRQDEFLNKAAAMAKLDPNALANVYAMQTGFGAGNTLAGAMGIQDPMLQQLSMRNQLAGQFDTSSAEGLINLSTALRQKGDLAGASQVAQQALLAREKEANIQAKLAERLTPEQRNSAAYADTVAERGTPKWTEAYQSKLGELTSRPEGKINYGAEADRLAKATFGKNFNELSQEQAALVDKTLEQRGLNKATASRATTVFQQESAFAKTLGEAQAKKLDAATEQATVSQEALSRLSQMKRLNDTGTLYQGPQANASVATANLLNSVGLLSKEEASKLSNSEVYSKLAKDLVMKDLGGKLGAQVSNADRDYIEARIPQLTTSPQARTELIAKLQEIHAKNINYARRMQTYAEKKGSLQGFDFIEGTPATSTPSVGTKENPIVLK